MRGGGDSPAGLRADMNSAIDLFLFYNLIQGVDNCTQGGVKNTFFTFKRDSEGYAVLLAPWDLNYSWGNRHADVFETAYVDAYGVAPDVNVEMAQNPAYILLQRGDEAVRRQLAARYAALRAGPWSDASVETFIGECEAQIFGSGAFLREQQRWPDGIYGEGDAAGLSALRRYALQRLGYLDQYVAALTR